MTWPRSAQARAARLRRQQEGALAGFGLNAPDHLVASRPRPGRRAGTAARDDLRAHIAHHRATGERDDLLGTLVAAHDADDGTLSEDGLLGNLILLFVAGHEATTNLLGNGLLTLLRHPPAWGQLRANPARLMPPAVDEMLRFESSVNVVPRHVVTPYAIGATVVPAGDLIFMTGAADRDPAVFAEPDRFDINRSPNPHRACWFQTHSGSTTDGLAAA